MPAYKIGSYLNASDIPHLAQARQLLKIQQVFLKIAPPQLAHFCRVGHFTQKTLTLFADSGAIAAKLKQVLPFLLLNFQKQGFDFNVIRVEVQVCSGGLPPTLGKPARLTPAGLESLQRLASKLPPSPLKTAVQAMLAEQPRRK